MTGMAHEQAGTIQNHRMGDRLLDMCVWRHAADLTRVVTWSDGERHPDGHVSEGLERHLCQGKVVAQLGADRHQDPRIAGLVEIRRRLGWGFPYAERANVVVPRRKSSEIEVKDSVGGM